VDWALTSPSLAAIVIVPAAVGVSGRLADPAELVTTLQTGVKHPLKMRLPESVLNCTVRPLIPDPFGASTLTLKVAVEPTGSDVMFEVTTMDPDCARAENAAVCCKAPSVARKVMLPTAVGVDADVATPFESVVTVHTVALQAPK